VAPVTGATPIASEPSPGAGDRRGGRPAAAVRVPAPDELHRQAALRPGRQEASLAQGEQRRPCTGRESAHDDREEHGRARVAELDIAADARQRDQRAAGEDQVGDRVAG
jgi:hypothetical protein